MASCQEILNESTEDKSSDLPPELLLQLKNVKLGESKTDERDKIIVPDWLKNFESPFLWHSQSKRAENSKMIIQKSLEKIEELKLEEPELTLQHFVLLLKLVLEYYVINDMENVWSTMKEVEDDFENMLTSASPECECKDFKMALGHLMFTTKAHLLMLLGDEEQSQKIARNIIPVKVMPVQEQAAMWALKARFYLYAGYEDAEIIGVEFAGKALEIDPDNADWSYLLAKFLRQKRKGTLFCDEVPKDELILMEKAVEKNKSVKYLIYLAQVYMECGSTAFKKNRFKPEFYSSPLNKSIQDMHLQALRFYKEALYMSPMSPSVLRRIGYGIMNLPKKIADYDLALHCLQKSLDISYSLITMHMLGTYYHRYANDNEKALEYFEKTAKEEVSVGLSDMVRVKYILDPQYDPRKDLEWGLTWKQKQKCRSLLLVQLAAYYLFVRRDLLGSIPYFNQVIEEDKDSPQMKIFKSFFLRMFEPIDLYQYVANEALLLLQKTETSKAKGDSTSDEEEIYTTAQLGSVEDLLSKISDARPELIEITPDPTMVDTLIQISKKNAQKEKKDFRNRNESRGRNFNRGDVPQTRRGRGGFYGNQRGRGGQNPNQQGRGGYRGGKEGYQQRNMGAGIENVETRGRFSLENQRDSGDYKARADDTSGKPHSANHRSNWRQRQDSSGDENCTKIENRPNDSRDWRKK